jgi:hypothetical protein
LAKSVLSAEEINTIFLFATDQYGNTVWQVAAEEETWRF